MLLHDFFYTQERYQYKQIFHCFGCGVGGDVFRFVSKIENTSFPEAVEILAERAGIEVPSYNSEGDSETAKLKSKVYEINQIAELLNLEENEIRVFGKGAKERIVLMSNRAKEYLAQYIKSARNLIPKMGYSAGELEENSPLFINNTGYRLQNKTIRKVINETVEKIELPKKVTPHVFRHSFATKLIENGADLRVVQELLGHAGISNTQIYTHVSMKHMKEVYETSHPHG